MIILSALLLAAAPASKPHAPVRPRPVAAKAVAPSSDWLGGLWIADRDKGEQMEGCAGWDAVFFQADGHYLHNEMSGQWSIDGDRLMVQRLQTLEGGGDEDEKVGDPLTSRVLRLSDDRMRLIDGKGQSTLYLRCPKPETPVAR
jgi:hypothetical protein